MNRSTLKGILQSRRGKLIAGGVAAVVLAGGGGALAASELSSSSAVDSGIISDAASQLPGVTPSALKTALTNAIDDQINSEVTAGQLTQTQADALEARIASGEVSLFNGLVGGFGGGGPAGRFRGSGFGGDLSAAASYLGLTTAQIATDEQNGETLAQIATAQGKTSAGLVQALVGAEESKLQSAVSAGNLSSTQEQTIEANLSQEITDLVDGARPAGFGGRFGGGPSGFGGGFADLADAATYLGLSTQQITSDLQSGQTLAQIATAQGKTSAGLVQALVSAEEARLQSMVSAGSLSSTQEQTIESNLSARIGAIVGASAGRGFRGFGRGRGFGFGFGHAGNPGFGGGAGSTTTTTTTTAS